jgi:hypothetical protein
MPLIHQTRREANKISVPDELSKIEKMVEDHCQKLMESYIEWHGR